MDKVLTARAWGWMDRDHTEMIANGANGFQRYPSDIPVVIVHGATEPDILAGLSLLAKSREVCEWSGSADDSQYGGYGLKRYDAKSKACGGYVMSVCPVQCPSCGRRVQIKEG